MPDLGWKNSHFYGLRKNMTDEQIAYVDSIFKNRLTITDSKAGTGKTTLAVAAAHFMQRPALYLFNPVEEGKLGFRPGTQQEKENDYLQPLRDALIAINENPMRAIGNNLIAMKNGAWVEAKSHIFARGTNIIDKTVIIDEAQNFTVPDLKKVLTRIHDNCKVIVIGHTGQIDLEKPETSGFSHLINHFKDKDYASFHVLTKNFRGQLAQDADEM